MVTAKRKGISSESEKSDRFDVDHVGVEFSKADLQDFIVARLLSLSGRRNGADLHLVVAGRSE